MRGLSKSLRMMVGSGLVAAGPLLALFALLDATTIPVEGAPGNSGPRFLVAPLAPHDGQALNAPTLRVQALVAAVTPDRHRTFVFDGQTIPGRNAGRIDGVDIDIDGRQVAQAGGLPVGRSFLVDESLDVSSVADGAHVLTITAFRGVRRSRREAQGQAQIAFTMDRTLTAVELNQVELLATPAPFTQFFVRPLEDDEDDDMRHEGRSPGRPNVHGRFALGGASDGIDLGADRVVIAAGSEIAVLEPGALRGNRHGRVYTYESADNPLIRRFRMERLSNRDWIFRIEGGPQWPERSTLHLRIGNDWGGLDLATGERLVRLKPELDASAARTSMIGPAGGAIETVGAGGVNIRLDVPADALTGNTYISVTPFVTSPLAASSGATFPGVELEPAGLVFAIPATLTFDFSATGLAPGADHFVFLLTSPLTMLPLPGVVDVAGGKVTAELSHFSPYQPGPGAGPLADPAAVINALHAPLSMAELQSAAQLLAFAQATGQDAGINLALLGQTVTTSLQSLFAQQCAAATANPTDAALNRLLQIDTLAQLFGVNAPSGLTTCESDVLEELIRIDGADARVDPSDARLQRLINRSAQAQQLTFPALETLALEQMVSALRVLLARGVQLCSSDHATGRLLLERALGYTALVSTVNAALAGELQAALNNCGGTPSEVTATFSGRVMVGGQVSNQPTNQMVMTGRGIISRPLPRPLPDPLPVPVPGSLAATAGLGSLAISFLQDGNTITLHGVASQGSGDPLLGNLTSYSDVAFNLDLELTNSVAGTYTITGLGGWALLGRLFIDGSEVIFYGHAEDFVFTSSLPAGTVWPVNIRLSDVGAPGYSLVVDDGITAWTENGDIVTVTFVPSR